MSNTMDHFEAVAEFNKAFDVSPSFDWLPLVEEEVTELEEAYLHLMKELADVFYVSTGLAISQGKGVEPLDMPQALKDRIMTVSNLIRTIGEDEGLEQAFELVHKSNMSKLLDDGTVLRRPEDGKVLKGPNYQPPDLSVLLK